MLRERLNGHKNVEYANYFPGHPELDDPEFYIRITGKSSVEKMLKEIVDGISKDFSAISL
jgi:DNA-directed RNA polymerase subunit L